MTLLYVAGGLLGLFIIGIFGLCLYVRIDYVITVKNHEKAKKKQEQYTLSLMQKRHGEDWLQ